MFWFQKREVKRLKDAEAAESKVASDPALLFLGDLCDHAKVRRERRAGEWAMLQVRRMSAKAHHRNTTIVNLGWQRKIYDI